MAAPATYVNARSVCECVCGYYRRLDILMLAVLVVFLLSYETSKRPRPINRLAARNDDLDEKNNSS